MDAVRAVEVTTRPIGVDGLVPLVARDAAGAVVTFAGVVRDHDDGRSVTRLEYEAHPTAPEMLAQVAHDVSLAHPDVALAAAHRIGGLDIGDVALAVAVSSAHRSQAFAAAAALVDEIKDRLPIWKHQFFADGDEEWVACP